MEQDMIGTGEQIEARDEFRTVLYGDMYQQPYAFARKVKRASGQEKTYAPAHDEDALMAANRSGGTKPYVPPTDFSEDPLRPYGDLLDEVLD